MCRQPSTTLQNSTPKLAGLNHESISQEAVYHGILDRERSGKGLGIRDALLCMSQTLQSALESGQEARIAQIDFMAAFDVVNHQEFSTCSALWVLEVLSCLY